MLPVMKILATLSVGRHQLMMLTPVTMSAAAMTRAIVSGSPSATTPTANAPTAPIPVHTVYNTDYSTPRYHRDMSATMYMRRCLELADIAARAGDTPVGALIVSGDQVVAEGVERIRTTLDPSAHAEIEAIRQACRHLGTLDLRGCSLYSTVEPCVLCGYAIRRTGIAHVVYGVPAGQAGACSSSYAILADRDLKGWPQVPEVTGGVLADECRAALKRTRIS